MAQSRMSTSKIPAPSRNPHHLGRRYTTTVTRTIPINSRSDSPHPEIVHSLHADRRFKELKEEHRHLLSIQTKLLKKHHEDYEEAKKVVQKFQALNRGWSPCPICILIIDFPLPSNFNRLSFQRPKTTSAYYPTGTSEGTKLLMAELEKICGAPRKSISMPGKRFTPEIRRPSS